MIVGEVGYRVLRGPQSPVAVVGGLELPLTRISPVGACAVAPSDLPFRDGEPASVELRVPGMPSFGIGADLGRAEVERDGTRRVNLGFRASDLAHARHVASLLEALRMQGTVVLPEARSATRQTIADPALLRPLLGMMARNRTRAILKRRGAGANRLLRLGEYLPDRDLLVFDGALPVQEGSLALELVGHTAMYEMPPLRVFEWNSDRMVTAAPPEITRFRRRSGSRALVSGEYLVRFRHPVWRQLFAERTVRDVSFRGLAFWCDAVNDLLYPGLELDEVEVVRDGLGPFRFSAEVRGVRLAQGAADTRGSEQIIGVSLTPSSPADAAAWAGAVGDQLYPRTRISPEASGQIWDVFNESGFFRLSGKEPHQFRRNRQDFERVSGVLSAAPEVGSRVCWVADERVECSISINKGYRHTWVGHQMARRPGVPGGASAKRVLRETFFRTFEMALADPDSRWILLYIDAAIRWSRAVTDFGVAHRATDEAMNFPFRLRDAAVDAPALAGIAAAVGSPEPGEVELLLETIRGQRSFTYCEVLDLLPGRIHLRELREQWAKAGMRRDRSIRIARCSGRPVAGAILDVAEPGTNMFHILDGVRLFVLPEGAALPGEAREDALLALLEDARRWYAGAGVDRFVYYQEREVAPHAERFGMADLGLGFEWAISVKLLPEWMEHIYELTSPRAPEPD